MIDKHPAIHGKKAERKITADGKSSTLEKTSAHEQIHNLGHAGHVGYKKNLMLPSPVIILKGKVWGTGGMELTTKQAKAIVERLEKLGKADYFKGKKKCK